MTILEKTKFELKNITWPKADKLIRLSTLIILTIIILSLYITMVDIFCTKLFYLLKNNF